jgi:hypothetical protein
MECGSPARDTVVVRPLFTADCYQEPDVSVSVVELAPSSAEARTAPVRAPVPALTPSVPDRRTVVVLDRPELEARITIRSPDAALARRIEASVRRTEVDANGCRDRVAAPRVRPLPAPARPGAGSELVPGAPESAGLCRYEGGWLVQSVTLRDERLTAFTKLLNGLPHGTSRRDPREYDPKTTCPEEANRGRLAHLTYPEGPSLTVGIDLSGCGELGATNGTVKAKRTDPLPERVVELVGDSGGWPTSVLDG